MTPSQRHPWLRPVAVLAHRSRRRVSWATCGADWASYRSPGDLPVRVHRHASLLLRRLEGADMVLPAMTMGWRTIFVPNGAYTLQLVGRVGAYEVSSNTMSVTVAN